MSNPSPGALPARRSARVDYDSNGRNYLCSVTGWSREQLDQWLTSDSVRSHLQLWYSTCISSERRCNESIDWINTGYYNDGGELEEDLLLMCMGEGGVVKDALQVGDPVVLLCAYSDTAIVTAKWITQEVWARTAWRIVQSNTSPGDAFEETIYKHPAAAYAFAIDILCLAFHSIVYRETDSVWEGIINIAAAPPNPEVQNDVDSDDNSDVDMDAELCSNVSSNEGLTVDDGSDEDEDFMDVVEPVTPKSKVAARKTASPKASKKNKEKEDAVMGENIVVAMKVNDWMDRMSEDEKQA
ncbi:hypothetical protein PRZ48_002836 [Zasmidium cellare]|uniref:Uncharacterized protein n=1 Tax=Zasmidium cellare TaxID=395010 RepID=A0ABR0EUP0_ZASCE|nr:hypothetical protein PRZ48_002836 [Zasmidium cellare]